MGILSRILRVVALASAGTTYAQESTAQTLPPAGQNGQRDLTHQTQMTTGSEGWTAFETALNRYRKSGRPIDHNGLNELRALIPPKEGNPVSLYSFQYALFLHPELTKLLLDAGMDPNGVVAEKQGLHDTSAGQTPLSILAKAAGGVVNPLTNAELLIKAGADIHARNNDGKAPFEIAVEAGNLAFAEYLMAKGVNTMTLNEEGKPMIQTLLDAFKESNPYLVDQLKNRISQASEENSNIEAVMTMPRVVRSQGIEKLIFLELAAAGTWVPMNRVLEENVRILGKTIESARAQDGEPVYENKPKDPLYYAVINGDKAAYDTLVAQGADPQSRYANGGGPNNQSLLHAAAKYDQREMMSALLGRGVDVNTKDGIGQTPLHVAAENGNALAVKKLLQAGADPNLSSDALGWNAAHYAVRSGDLDTVEAVLQAGVNLELRDVAGLRPLDRAMQIHSKRDADLHQEPIVLAISQAMKNSTERNVVANVSIPTQKNTGWNR